jgi:hypothetical protein
LVLIGLRLRRYPPALAGTEWLTNRNVDASSAPITPAITKTVGKLPVPEVGRLATRLPCPTFGRVSVGPVLVRIGEVVLTLLVPVALLLDACWVVVLCACRSGYAFQSAVGGFRVCCVRVASALIPGVDAASASPTQKTTDRRSTSPRDLVPLI